MRYSSLILLTVGAIASQVAGSVIEARSSLEFIFRRQTNTTLCATECSTFQNYVNECQGEGCMCTTPIASALSRCVNCHYEGSAFDIDAGNHLVDHYESVCPGIPLSVTTGAGGGGPPTASATSTTSAGTTTATTASETDPIVAIEPVSITQMTIRPPTTTAGPSGTNSGQSLSAGVYSATVAVALALGAFAF
ncbi:hypothetical protein H1R20_g14032, partial [Candolleomyces eurysporus]